MIPDRPARCRFIAGLLAVRGLRVDALAVDEILAQRSGRFDADHQEYKLARGASEMLTAMRARALDGVPPDGRSLVALFRRFVAGLERFRNNTLRRDAPWDALRGVEYPDARAVDDLLDGFASAASYGEPVETFTALHPVRQAIRVLWRFARIAPFPDFNLPMAVVAMNAHLLGSGYPLLPIEAGDRARLELLVRERPRTRVVWLERRVLQALDVDPGTDADA